MFEVSVHLTLEGYNPLRILKKKKFEHLHNLIHRVMSLNTIHLTCAAYLQRFKLALRVTWKC